jgi:hypothetical protein
MESESDGRRRLTLAIHWTARAWAITSIGLILLLCIGQMPSTPRDWMGFVLYPAGIVAGMILAWWREGLGGSITVGSLLAFYVLHTATVGRLPKGWAWLVLAAPGFLFLWSWKRSRKPSATAA